MEVKFEYEATTALCRYSVAGLVCKVNIGLNYYYKAEFGSNLWCRKPIVQQTVMHGFFCLHLTNLSIT